MATSGYGAKLLARMGWTEGTGLGANRDGITSPLKSTRNKGNRGIGAQKKPFEDAWWERAMEEAYGKPDSADSSDGLLDACEGRRCRPHGKSKLERIEAHDAANAILTSRKFLPDKETSLEDKRVEGSVLEKCSKRKSKGDSKVKKKRKRERCLEARRNSDDAENSSDTFLASDNSSAENYESLKFIGEHFSKQKKASKRSRRSKKYSAQEEKTLEKSIKKKDRKSRNGNQRKRGDK